jgi:uncharacterized protein YqjF (DUF2071 family)
MRQNWGKLLFIHWPVSVETLRPLIPAGLSVDTFDGAAWIAVAPFTLWGLRFRFTPPAPRLSKFHELNVRTYVHRDGVPGVWFFSLDATSRAAVFGARAFYRLPYFNARINLRQHGDTIDYELRRTDTPPAEFRATWEVGDALPESEPGSLAFFLTERYCLYAARGERLYRARVHHAPWPLRRATLSEFRSTMIESHGLKTPGGEPLLHYAESLAVDVWPLERV